MKKIIKINISLITTLLICTFSCMTQDNYRTYQSGLHHNLMQEEIHWDWDQVNLDDATFWRSLTFPQDFKWGVATAAFQIEGTKTHNGHVENSFTIGEPERRNNEMCGHWDRYKEDVQLIKQLGVNQYRLNIPWEKIEPQEGEFDTIAMDHYIDEIKELRKNGIEPMVCLFHFKLPVWFYKKSGFEKEENLQYFVRFCTYVFEKLNDQVVFWSVYNEPIAYVVESYHTGKYPPYEKGFLNLAYKAGIVLKNLLKAHITIYQQCKVINPNVQIGLIKMFFILDPYNNRTVERFICNAANSLTIDSVLDFFKNGSFSWFNGLISYTDHNAPQCLDFIGVNYYRHELIASRYFVDFKRRLAREDEPIIPETKRAIYPEGLYRAIAKAAELHLPIYITENGVATHDEQVRNEFIKKHLYVVQKALDNDFDIRGYHYWTLFDMSPYGLYAVDCQTKERTLRDGAQPFVTFLHRFFMLIA